MISNIPPIIWIAAIAAVVVIGGIALWRRSRQIGDSGAGATMRATQEQPALEKSDPASSLANIATASSVTGGATLAAGSDTVDAQPASASVNDERSPAASGRAAAGASAPRKSTAAKKSSRKKPAPKRTSQKKTAKKR